MRHRNKINSLGRKAAHRKETLSSMACALILHKRINTTVAKAKALRVYVEPLITRSKVDSTHSRRMVFSYLKNKHAVSELFREVAQKVADRPGGYTRILKTGFRKGDAAEMCFIELVDYNTAMLSTEEETQQKRTRRGRRGGKKSTQAQVKEQKGEETTAPETATAEKEEQPAAEVKETKTENNKEETPAAEKAEEKTEETKEDKPAAETKEDSKKEEGKQKDAGNEEEKGSDEPEKADK